MKQTLIIHIGWHKTASTVLQLYFDNYRKQLKKHNVCYPVIDNRSGFGGAKHSDLLLSIFKELDFGNQKVDVRRFDELLTLSVKEIVDSKCRWVILSEEAFSMEHPGIAKLMGRYKEYFDDIRIVAYIRRQDYFFESYYAQVVKQKVTRDSSCFDKFIVRPRIQDRANYSKILGWWAEVFGLQNILVSPFEPHIIVPDPVTHFFKLAGLPEQLLERFPVEQQKTHGSPPREVTEFYRYMNKKGNDYHEKVLTEYLLKSGARLTNTKYFSRAARERILLDYEESNRQVAITYLNKKNGILFEEPVNDYADCPNTWNGLKPYEILHYALPVIGMMSFEISRLRIENQMMSTLRKMISRLFAKLYNYLKKKGIREQNLP